MAALAGPPAVDVEAAGKGSFGQLVCLHTLDIPWIGVSVSIIAMAFLLMGAVCSMAKTGDRHVNRSPLRGFDGNDILFLPKQPSGVDFTATSIVWS